jgi:RNA-directed DNA polymerase
VGAGKKRASNLHDAMTTRGQSDADKASPEPRDSGETAKHSPREVLSTGANEQKENPGQNDKLMEQAADPANLNTAWKRVRDNGGAPGIDGITVHAFLEQAKPRSESLRKDLLEGSYRPSPLRRVKIPKPAGGERLLGIPTVQDRVVQQAFLQVLQPILDPTFSEHSEN